MPLDILAIGSISIDYIQSEIFFGGTAANVAVNCARLGLATGLFSAASTDEWGKRYRDFLQSEEVLFMHVPQRLERLPEYHVSLGSDGTIKDMVWHDNGIAQAFKSVRQSQISLPPAQIMHFGACEPSFVHKVIEAAPEGQLLSYNPGGWLTYDVDYFAAAYPKARFLFLNAYEYQCLVSANLVREPVDLCANEAQLIVITRGSEPIWIVQEGRLAEIPIDQVAAIDETGAGDSFISAFLWGWTAKLPPERCVHLAILFAGLATQQFGAQVEPGLVQRFKHLAAGR